jgi:heavy metal sensor kinase
LNTRSIRFRLIAWYAGLLVVLVIAFGNYTFQSVGHFLSSSLRQTLTRRAEQIARTLSAQMNASGVKDMAHEIEELYAPEINDRFIRIGTADGRTLYLSGKPADNSFDPARVPTISADASQTVTRLITMPQPDRLLVVSVPFQANGQHYWAEVGSSEAANNAVLRGLLITLLAGLSFVAVIAGLGGFLLLSSALRPVREAIRTAREITLLDLGKRLPVYPSGDEIERLSVTFNQMIGRIEDYFQTTRRFTSDASHELRTPLAIIRGDIETLLMHENLSEQVRERLESLLEEVERLSGIVKGLLALTRLDAEGAQRTTARFDFVEVISTTVELVRPLAEDKDIELSFTNGPAAEIAGDVGRIKQVIVNLLDNAIKYTPSGGKIDVTVKAVARQAVLTVTDTGAGVPAESLPRIFERFYRADTARSREVDGAGLGLSIVWSICTAHGGAVRAENLPVGGCRFTVEIPLAQKE